MSKPAEHCFSHSERGSATLAVLLIGTILTLIAIAYMRTSVGELERANRSFVQLSLMTGVDNIVEEVLQNLATGDWQGWEKREPYRYKESTVVTSSGDTMQWLAVIDESAQSQPELHLRASATSPHGRPVIREFSIRLARRSAFQFGLHLRDRITLNGQNIELSSFDSREGPFDPATNRSDKIAVAVATTESDSIRIGNASIYGWLLTSGLTPNFGPQAGLRSFQTPVQVRIDPARLLDDLPADFPQPLDLVSPPAEATPLPPFSGQNLQLGSAEDQYPRIYRATNFTLNNPQTIRVDGPVDIHLSGRTRLRGEIVIANNGRLRLFLDGDLTVSGKGFAGANHTTDRLILYGLAGCDSIDLSGQAIVRGSIFAPNATLTLSGGGNQGSFEGAATAAALTVNGNYKIHHDLALREAPIAPLRHSVTSWREPTQADMRFNFAPFTAFED